MISGELKNNCYDILISANLLVQNTRGKKCNLGKGPFNNYVDKMREGGGQKMSVFVHAQGIKTVHKGEGGQKMAKFCPRSC